MANNREIAQLGSFISVHDTTGKVGLANSVGIGTTSLVAMGCIMVRQCHSNTCPVGVCTQDENLRKKFSGTPEKVVNLSLIHI